MAKITRQNYIARRNGFGKVSQVCDTGTAPANVVFCGYGPESSPEQRMTFVLYNGEQGDGGRFKVMLSQAECIKLATIMLGETMTDAMEAARLRRQRAGA